MPGSGKYSVKADPAHCRTCGYEYGAVFVVSGSAITVQT
jgi:predicted Zn-ribbon and HTH transcriptional regulator